MSSAIAMVSRRPASFTSPTTTLAPASARTSAVSRPMPPPPPVITAVRPARSNSSLMLIAVPSFHLAPDHFRLDVGIEQHARILLLDVAHQPAEHAVADQLL